MTHVRRIVDGRSTVVPVYLTAFERYEWVLYSTAIRSANTNEDEPRSARADLLASQRVVNLQDGFFDKRFRKLPFRLGHLGSSSLSHGARVEAKRRPGGMLLGDPGSCRQTGR